MGSIRGQRPGGHTQGQHNQNGSQSVLPPGSLWQWLSAAVFLSQSDVGGEAEGAHARAAIGGYSTSAATEQEPVNQELAPAAALG